LEAVNIHFVATGGASPRTAQRVKEEDDEARAQLRREVEAEPGLYSRKQVQAEREIRGKLAAEEQARTERQIRAKLEEEASGAAADPLFPDADPAAEPDAGEGMDTSGAEASPAAEADDMEGVTEEGAHPDAGEENPVTVSDADEPEREEELIEVTPLPQGKRTLVTHWDPPGDLDAFHSDCPAAWKDIPQELWLLRKTGNINDRMWVRLMQALSNFEWTGEDFDPEVAGNLMLAIGSRWDVAVQCSSVGTRLVGGDPRPWRTVRDRLGPSVARVPQGHAHRVWRGQSRGRARGRAGPVSGRSADAIGPGNLLAR
jgi:hypothetical protein